MVFHLEGKVSKTLEYGTKNNFGHIVEYFEPSPHFYGMLLPYQYHTFLPFLEYFLW